MLFDQFDQLNWLAVIVAALAYFVLGAIWFSNAVMGKQWREATGKEMGEGGRPEPKALIVNFIAWLVAAFVLALIVKGIGADDFGDAIVLGLSVSIGFIGTNRIVQGMYEGYNPALTRINAPYTILGFLIMSVILSLWT